MINNNNTNNSSKLSISTKPTIMSSSSPVTTKKLPASFLSYRKPQKQTVYETGVTLTVDIDHIAEAEKKEAIRLAENKRKLEEMVRAISERANANLRKNPLPPPPDMAYESSQPSQQASQPSQPPTAPSASTAASTSAAAVDKRGEEWVPEKYYSETLGCEFTFPLSKFLSNYKHCNPSFRNSYNSYGGYGYTNPYHRQEEQKEPPKKMMKFDPPTFKWGIDPKEEEEKKKKEEQEEERKKKQQEEDAYNAYVIPSHVPGVKWSQREIDMLVESSRRWMRDSAENEERYKKNREAVEAAEAAAKRKRENQDQGDDDVAQDVDSTKKLFTSPNFTNISSGNLSSNNPTTASAFQGSTTKPWMPALTSFSQQPFFPSSKPLLSSTDSLLPLPTSSSLDNVNNGNDNVKDETTFKTTKRVSSLSNSPLSDDSSD